MTANAVAIEQLQFSYHADKPVLAIKELVIKQGEIVFLHGPSGCGKTTLLGLLAGVLSSKEGHLSVLDQNLAELSHARRDRLRGESIGYIFQIFNLVPYLNVEENILLPTMFGRAVSDGFSTVQEEAAKLASDLGVGHLLKRPVTELSIGQQQRVAAARALIGSPGLILADEPTSALDADARVGFLDLLFTQARREKATVLFVSHDRSLASRFDRELSLPELNTVKGVQA